MPDLLLEIGLEEVPARMIESAEAELKRRVVDLLVREHLLEGAVATSLTPPATFAVNSYSTPRRLAVLITGVIAQQPDLTEEVTGPAVKIAYKDGVPTPAAEAFAKKNGIAVADLKTISTPKGDYLAASVTKKGRSAAEVLTTELPKEIAALYWAKNMRWIPESKQTFVRPVLWLVCLLGETVVPIEFGGRTAARASYGHRVLSTGDAFEIQTPDSYLAQLEGEYVLADVEARRHKIRKALDRVTKATRNITGPRWREDEPLVDAVTHLTEWPDVLLGSFEPTYLALPEEVLVTVMRDHQKYFAVEDASGKLAPHFLTVTNISLNETNTPIIRQGNERVLRARFNDAKFFWDFDQKTPLTERVKLLENVTFQKDLGSYAKKTERNRSVAAKLAAIAIARGWSIRTDDVDLAATLAKTDLTTELVKEFTELQGVIGGLYAEAQGIPITAAVAIRDQYVPSSSDDGIPMWLEGCILGLADRIDTIAGMFTLGMEPTGSKDPFALRRAANGVVRILDLSDLRIRLSEALDTVELEPSLRSKLDAFFTERIEFYLREVNGQAYDVVKAVMAAGSDDIEDLVARAEAVSSMRGSDDFLAVSAAFKRMKNILAQANFPIGLNYELDAAGEPVETALHAKFTSVDATVGSLAAERKYAEALAAIATLRPEVDAFFEGVMVNDPDAAVRERRLTQLALIVSSFSGIADFSEIVTAG